MPNPIERREHTRIKVRWPIAVVTDDSTIEGETRDITTVGMFINCKEPLELNESYRISVIPPNQQSIDITCKVLWSNLYSTDGENTYGMGFCFVKVSDEDSHLLSDVLSMYYE
ncbi:MAG: PilZ domain-containing protein [Deltaproteobacteria bacterium]|nr:PilZ domain-containing protein [Deltaproteobacteria bacterium]